MQSAIEELARLEHAFDNVKAQLLDRLHDVVRRQLFHNAPPVSTEDNAALLPETSANQDRSAVLLPHDGSPQRSHSDSSGADHKPAAVQ